MLPANGVRVSRRRIWQLAMERGMSTLRDDGLNKIQNGVTTSKQSSGPR